MNPDITPSSSQTPQDEAAAQQRRKEQQDRADARVRRRLMTEGPDPSEEIEERTKCFDSASFLRAHPRELAELTEIARVILPVALQELAAETDRLLMLEEEKTSVAAELTRLESGGFDPDEVSTDRVLELMNTARAKLASASARVTQTANRIDQLEARILGQVENAARILKEVNQRALPAAEAHFHNVLRPLFPQGVYDGDFYVRQWKRELVNKTLAVEQINERERSLRFLTKQQIGRNETSVAFAKRKGRHALDILERALAAVS